MGKPVGSSKRLEVILSCVFFFSGFASLIYQIVWQRLLTVHYGVGTISISIIVSVYMFGLGLGALLGGALAERIENRILLYFGVELLIGCFGLISLPFLDLLGRFTAGSNYLISSLCVFLFLCLPTLLMGITLPLLVKIFNAILKDFLKSLSSLYFVNTLGAAAGALFSSYFIISFFGLDSAAYLAALINLILAILIYVIGYLSSRRECEAFDRQPKTVPLSTLGISYSAWKSAYFFVFITGFLAIGYELIFVRVIGVLVKDSPYAFSTVLSVYLFGIAVGSSGMEIYVKKACVPGKNHFFIIQSCLAISILLIFTGYYYLTKHTYWGILTEASFLTVLHPLPQNLFSGNLMKSFSSLDVFYWPILFVLGPAILMGASFPLIAFLALADPMAEGKTVGWVYFWNTIGNLLGAIVTGLLLLPYFGTETTILLFSSTGIVMAIFINEFRGKHLTISCRIVAILVILSASVLVFPDKGKLYEVMHIGNKEGFKSYFEEGIDGTVMTYKRDEEIRNYINGQGHGGRPNYSFVMEAMETMSYCPEAKDILIIGYGTGTTVETVLKSAGVQNVTVVELNKTLIHNLKNIPFFHEMLTDRRVNLILDDGRRYLLRTDKMFDVIMMDPVRTTTSYSNNVYSYEFFELAGRHLRDFGALMVWMDEDKVLPKTVATVFEYVRMYGSQAGGGFCVASKYPLRKQEKMLQELLSRYSPETRKEIMGAFGTNRYLGDRNDILLATKHFPVNHDWKPVCEYYLGLLVRKALFHEK